MTMETVQSIEERHSCRRFDSERNVDDALIEKILLAGTRAPSAKNRQPWRFVVLSDVQAKKDVARAMLSSRSEVLGRGLEPKVESYQVNSLTVSAKVIVDAPVVVFVCYQRQSAWSAGSEDAWECKIEDYEAVDMLGIGACMENMSLAATSLGVANLWICDVLYAADVIREILGASLPLIAAMALGYENTADGSHEADRAESGDKLTSWPSRTTRLPLSEVCRYVR